MVEDLYPYKKYNIEINAAEIGISKGEIEFVNRNESEDKALKKMKENRFDVLPIKEPNEDEAIRIFKS